MACRSFALRGTRTITRAPFHIQVSKAARSSSTLKSKPDFTQESFYVNTRKRLSEASTLPKDVYSSQAIFELEKVNIFEKSWMCVALITQLPEPGCVVTVMAGTQPILLVRNKQGEINAFKNVCRHRGHKVCLHDGKYPTLMCKYHRWAYNYDGKLIATPLFDKNDSAAIRASLDTTHVKNFDRADYSLFPVRVATFANMIFVNVSGDAPPISDFLGDLPTQITEHLPTLSNVDQLVSVRTKRYDIASNWKLLQENFMEYYHLPSVHPGLVTVSGMDEHMRAQGPGCYVGLITDPLTSSNTPIDPYVLPHFPNLTGRNNSRAIYHHIFPNVFYFLYPHSIFTVISFPDPNDPTRTQEFSDLSVLRSVAIPENEEKIEAMWKFYSLTNVEDLEVCEGVQTGLRAYEYTSGRLSFRFEETIHRFQNMVADHLAGNPRIPPGDDTSEPGSARHPEPNN